MYSPEWQNECRKELENLCEKVSQNGFPEDFVNIQKLYYQFSYYAQQLNAPPDGYIYEDATGLAGQLL